MSYLITLYIPYRWSAWVLCVAWREWVSLRSLRRASTAEQVREWVRVSVGIRRLGFISMMALLASGLYMMFVARNGGAWVIVAFWSLVLLAIIAVTLSFRRMAAIGRAVGEATGPLAPRPPAKRSIIRCSGSP